MEALILYFVIFFPGIAASPPPDWLANGIDTVRTVPFSVLREFGRTLTHTLPALALLLYLISKGKPQPVNLRSLAPHKRDILPFVIGLPALIIIGLLISFLISLSAAAPPPRIEGPYNFIGWAAMIVACLGIGYLEEIYFRYYLLSRMENIIPQTAVRVVFSTVLFSLCHMHDGPWGVLNAAVAGLFLSALFLRYRSIHGVALAHAGYNMFVYVMGTA